MSKLLIDRELVEAAVNVIESRGYMNLVEALRKALAQEQEQEPVAWAIVQSDGFNRHIGPKHDFVPEGCKEIPLYAKGEV